MYKAVDSLGCSFISNNYIYFQMHVMEVCTLKIDHFVKNIRLKLYFMGIIHIIKILSIELTISIQT